MKLKYAYMCLDCEEIFEPEIFEFLDQKVRQSYCPACGSGSIARLSRWIKTMAEHEKEMAA